MNYLYSIFTIVWKDLTNEFRIKEVVSAILVYTFLVLTIFSLTFTIRAGEIATVFPGIMWVTLLFPGIMGLNRTFINEKINNSLFGLMLAPVRRSVILASKIIANLIIFASLEIVTIPLIFIFFDIRNNISIFSFIFVIFLATLGFVSTCTFLSAISINTKANEILLPLILFPLIVPLIISAVEATKDIMAGNMLKDILLWVKLLVVYDIVFLLISFLLFEFVLEVGK